MAKNAGKLFEDMWKTSCGKYGLYYLRLVDSNKFGTGIGATTRFTPENKYDSLMYKYPYVWMLELKSSQGTGISFAPNTPNVAPEGKRNGEYQIKPSQVRGLLEATEHEGTISGLLLNYREEKRKLYIDLMKHFLYIY